MEEILKKVEDFSDDEEILGAYDAEWHKQQVEEVVRLAYLEEIEEAKEKIEEAKEELESKKAELESKKVELESKKEEFLVQGINQEKINTVLNMKKENLDIELISKVTGLSIEQIKKIK